MTTTSTTCGVCEAAINSGYACSDCITLLLDDIGRLVGRTGADGRFVHGLVVDVMITASKQDRMQRGVGQTDIPSQTRGIPLAVAATPSPGRFDALALHARILTALRLAMDITRTYQLPRIAQSPDITRLIHEVSGEQGLVTRAERLVDRPDGAFRIPCPTCGRRVGIDVQREIITCRCGEWGTVDWWTTHVAPEVVDTEQMTAKDAILWLAVRHNLTITECQIRQWAVRYPGQLRRVGKDPSGRTMYPPAQLLTLAQRVPRATQQGMAL